MHALIAQIVPKPQHLAEARTALENILPATRAEPGCRVFNLLEGDGALWLYEEWDDKAALEAHYIQPYTREVFAAYQDWLAEPVDITELEKLG